MYPTIAGFSLTFGIAVGVPAYVFYRTSKDDLSIPKIGAVSELTEELAQQADRIRKKLEVS